MKTFVCKVCGHIEFNEITANCPVCGAPITSFEDKPDLIHKPGEATNFTEPEKKHIPKIVLVKTCGLIPEGCFDVHVKVGEIEHPMLKEHYIRFIDFYLDQKYLSRVYLTPERLHPAAALHIKAGTGLFTAVEHCNIHGYWKAETTL
jgi:superoxide reductase